MRAYTQTIRVTFQSEAAAHKAQLRILPLYHDFRAAFSSRWDDSTVNDMRAAQVMAKYGQEGTFYLNSLGNWYQDSKETGIVAPADPGAEIPRILLAGGNSLGGHTLNHEMTPALSKNAAFKEILGLRVALESHAASPVVSFVYPFVFIQSPLRGGVDRADIEEMLRRSGYYDLAEDNYNSAPNGAPRPSGLLDARFVIMDGHAADAGLTQFLATPAGDDRPLFLVTMHAWVSAWGGPEFPLLDAIYKKWSGRDDLWYTTPNHYAAYRYQSLYSQLDVRVKGRVLTAQLLRPDPLDLDDGTPLTFEVDGAGKADIVSAECASAEVKPAALGDSYAFDLFHDRDRGPIESYAETDNPSNSDQLDAARDGSGPLQALLFRRGPLLSLVLHNNTAQPLANLNVTFRLPLRWQQGVVHRQVEALAAGASVKLDVSLAERPDPAHYSDGLEYDVAQIDYQGQARSRLYATSEIQDGEPAPSFARNGFLILGPLPGDVVGLDPRRLSEDFFSGQAVRKSYTLPTGETVQWKALDPARASILDPDIIPTTGKNNIPASYLWDKSIYTPHTGLAWLLYGTVVSPETQTVRGVFCKECVKQISLNGKAVPGDQLDLKKGRNDIRIFYVPTMATKSDYTENNYGCYFRLTGADGRPVESLLFERPQIP